MAPNMNPGWETLFYMQFKIRVGFELVNALTVKDAAHLNDNIYYNLINVKPPTLRNSAHLINITFDKPPT